MTRDESGQIAGVEGLVFGVLVFVLGLLLVANTWAVIDARVAPEAAAREGVRAFVEASGDTDSAAADAARAASDALAGHGRDPERMGFDIGDSVLSRCARATVRVTYQVPAVALPVLGHRRPAFTVSATASEVVDPYRSGLGDRSQCA